MRIAVVHNAVNDNDRADEQDVLVQADAVCDALAGLGYETARVVCTLDLAGVKRRLEAIAPQLVFNLVESLDGRDRLIHLFPALLDAMGLAYTGSCTEALLLTSNKVLAKERMVIAGLSTPAWVGPYPKGIFPLSKSLPPPPAGPWIIKSLWEHGSLGLDSNDFVLEQPLVSLNQTLMERAKGLGGSCFAEAFIQGREFNLSILQGPEGPEVLPPAEIVFEDYRVEKPQVVDYRAKWDTGSFEYLHTPRRFEFPPDDEILLKRLKSSALRCWDLFGLGGYGRVDFRVDSQGCPFILEVNCNPCLSPDAGFAASVLRSGLSFADAVERIVRGAISHKKR
jgi:D-alanine-D-alanine ligase